MQAIDIPDAVAYIQLTLVPNSCPSQPKSSGNFSGNRVESCRGNGISARYRVIT